jgi:ribosomal protein S18 acetylase RimI-like enzyme
METSIRPFASSDIEFALAQTGREGWDTTAELFEACLAHDPQGSFIAETDGRPVAMVTTTSHARSGWIGNLIVVPEQRRRGLGQHLATQALTHLTDCGMRTIRLEADPLGIGIYRRLGFVDEFESLRFRLTPSSGRRPAEVEPVTAADLPAIADYDAPHFGDDRGWLLELLFRQATATYSLRDGAQMRGYAFTVLSTLGVRLGPFVATGRQAAGVLLQAVMADQAGTTIVLGVSCLNDGAVDLYESHGFERSPSSFRMMYGGPDAGGHPRNVFAIANGAMG